MRNIIQKLTKEYQNGTWTPNSSSVRPTLAGSCEENIWGGAGLIVTDATEDCYKNDSAVVLSTKHVNEVSSVVFELRDRLTGYLDSLSKYSFYPRIGEAGKRAITKYGDSYSSIIAAMLREASIIAKDWDLHLYFAYGSNMDETQMRDRCAYAEKSCRASLHGYRFSLDRRGVATIVPSETDTVEGLLWEVCSADIECLDGYEGVAGGYYRREMIEVDIGMWHPATVIVYISNSPISDRPSLRRGYMEKIIAASKKEGLPKDYVAMLKSINS
ncbi:MAG: gamma-glutamylcyclotransferase [Eubacterium sp.]|nr:gamma-glutamylcyclotransferase [Eubacterium sp.]